MLLRRGNVLNSEAAFIEACTTIIHRFRYKQTLDFSKCHIRVNISLKYYNQNLMSLTHTREKMQQLEGRGSEIESKIEAWANDKE